MTTETGSVSDGRPLDIPRTTSAGPYVEGERETESKRKNHSSRSDALPRGRAIEEADAAKQANLTEADVLVFVALRQHPAWSIRDGYRWARNDDRSWDDRLAAASATNPDIRHPNGLRYVNPADGTHTPTPPTPAQLNDPRLRCEHGAFAEPPSACCRKGLEL